MQVVAMVYVPSCEVNPSMMSVKNPGLRAMPICDWSPLAPLQVWHERAGQTVGYYRGKKTPHTDTKTPPTPLPLALPIQLKVASNGLDARRLHIIMA